MKAFTHPLFLAFLSGILFYLGWPTLGFPLFLFIAFVPLLLAENTLRTSRYSGLKIFGLAYISFLIWNFSTTAWLYYASLFGVLIAVLVNSLLMALIFLLFHRVAQRSTPKIYWPFFISIWLVFEKMHLHWEFSWPWLNLGNGFSEYPSWIQWYEYTGTFGGSLWILLMNILFFNLIQNYLQEKRFPFPKLKPILFWGMVPLLYSFYLYQNYTLTGTQKEVILLQPNVDPYTEKYSKSNLEVITGLLNQVQEKITPNTQYIVAPETVLAENVPYEYFPFSSGKNQLHRFINQYPNISFLLGIDTYDILYNKALTNPASNQVEENVWVNFYNSALFINNNSPIQKYNKSKLVVGVENLPYKPFFEPLLKNYMIDLGGTMSTKTTQEERSVFTDKDGTKIAPVICYESVYGEYVTGYVKNKAHFLAIMTNDAWWNETQGHLQHLSLARLRAIETRKDVARSANTGISAFINQKGDITQQTKYNQKTSLLGKVNLNQKETFYVKYGDYIARIALFLAGILSLVAFTKRKSVIG